MNYYEELGIYPDATPAEIREAYKLAARLLHPDMQRDERLKDVAECQMRRLSEVVATLVDPRERARYDATLANRTRPEQFSLLALDGRSELWNTAVRHWFWVLLASMTIGMGVWYGLARGTDPPPRINTPQTASAPAASVPSQRERSPVKDKRVKSAESAKPRNADQYLPMQHAAAEESVAMERAAPATTAATAAERENPEHTAMPVVQEARPDTKAPFGDEPRFGGQWLLAAEAEKGGRVGTYPARYVELLLREEHGRLAGEYRAVYSRLDKAISPEVVFHVHGELPQGSAGALEWESNAGAKGELEVTLQAPNRLLVKWWTTQFGTQEVLSSGMAGLIRLKNP